MEQAPVETPVEAPAEAAVETPAVETPAVAADVSMEDTIRETYRELTQPRERDEGGRFVGKAATPADAASTEGEAAAAAPAAAAEPWHSAPNTWKKEVAANYATLPDAVKQEIHRREEDFHKGIGQYKDAAAFGHSLFEDLSPHFDTMRQLGATPKEVVRDVMNAWRSLTTGTPDQKRDTLLRLAAGFGISLGDRADTRDRETSDSPELAPVLQRLAQLEGTITESQRAREAAEHAERVAQAQKFLSDPKREHLEAVFEDVVALVRAGKAPEDAYEQAIWAHPETRAKLLAKQDDERKRADAERAAAARKAAVVNVQKRGAPPAAAKPGTMEDTIRQEYRRLNSG